MFIKVFFFFISFYFLRYIQANKTRPHIMEMKERIILRFETTTELGFKKKIFLPVENSVFHIAGKRVFLILSIFHACLYGKSVCFFL
jgi:hypothetical protein